jgi:hypothetical protein
MGAIRDIDHLMLGVADPDEAAADMERIGFTTTPLSRMPAHGLANRCVLLTPATTGVANYLELLGHEPAHANPFMRELLGGGEGIKSLVLATDDIDAACKRLRAVGAPTGPPVRIERPWRLPNGETLDLAFTVATPALGAPPVYCNLCQHHTLHHYLRPDWRRHENGAMSLVAVLVEADRPEDVSAWYARLFDQKPDVAIEARRVAGATPRAIGFAIAVENIEATKRLLAARGVAHERGDNVIALDLRGCRIEFRRESHQRPV